MQAPVKHIIQQQTFWLSAHRCIFWEEESALIVSDLHLGKTGHFRKHGIAVPQQVFMEDMQRLADLVGYFRPGKMIAVGDLFHSHANRELELFLKWRNDFAGLDYILVKGNHDILNDDWYESAGIRCFQGQWQLNGIHFVHDPADISEDEGYVFAGHLHPGVRFSGMGKQSLQFPCFHFGEKHAVLPAFSKFSGLSGIRAGKNDAVFAIVDGKLLSV